MVFTNQVMKNEQITILIRETSNIKKLSLKSMILFAKNACHLKDLGPILCRKQKLYRYEKRGAEFSWNFKNVPVVSSVNQLDRSNL